MKKVKCGCMKGTDKGPLQEGNVTVPWPAGSTEQKQILSDSTNIISLTSVNVNPSPVTSDPISAQGSVAFAKSRTSDPTETVPTAACSAPKITSITNCNPTAIDSNLKQVPVLSTNLNAVENKAISPTSTQQSLTTGTKLVLDNPSTTIVTSGQFLNVSQTNITNSQVISPRIQNLPIVEKNIISNLGPGTLILADGRIVSVPPIVPQIIVKQRPALIVVPSTKTKEKLLMPKKREVTKTTFANKAPIPAIPTFRLESCPRIRKKKLKLSSNKLEKLKESHNNKNEVKKRKIESDDLLILTEPAVGESITENNSLNIPQESVLNSETVKETVCSNNTKITSSADSLEIAECSVIVNSSVIETEKKDSAVNSRKPSTTSSTSTPSSEVPTEASVEVLQLEEKKLDNNSPDMAGSSSLVSNLNEPESLTPPSSNTECQNISVPRANVIDSSINEPSSSVPCCNNSATEDVNLPKSQDTNLSLFSNNMNSPEGNTELTDNNSSGVTSSIETIRNIPPCISSSTVQDSAFVPSKAAILSDGTKNSYSNVSSNSIPGISLNCFKRNDPSKTSPNDSHLTTIGNINISSSYGTEGECTNKEFENTPTQSNGATKGASSEDDPLTTEKCTFKSGVAHLISKELEKSQSLASSDNIKIPENSQSNGKTVISDSQNLLKFMTSVSNEHIAGNKGAEIFDSMPEHIQSTSSRNSQSSSTAISLEQQTSNSYSQQVTKESSYSANFPSSNGIGIPSVVLSTSGNGTNQSSDTASYVNQQSITGITTKNNIFSESTSKTYRCNPSVAYSHSSLPSNEHNPLPEKANAYGVFNQSFPSEGVQHFYSQNVCPNPLLKDSLWDTMEPNKIHSSNNLDQSRNKEQPGLNRDMIISKEQDKSQISSSNIPSICPNHHTSNSSVSCSDPPSNVFSHNQKEKSFYPNAPFSCSSISNCVDKLTFGVYPNSTYSNVVSSSIQPNIPMYSSFPSTNVYGNTDCIVTSGSPITNNNSSYNHNNISHHQSPASSFHYTGHTKSSASSSYTNTSEASLTTTATNTVSTCTASSLSNLPKYNENMVTNSMSSQFTSSNSNLSRATSSSGPRTNIHLDLMGVTSTPSQNNAHSLGLRTSSVQSTTSAAHSSSYISPKLGLPGLYHSSVSSNSTICTSATLSTCSSQCIPQPVRFPSIGHPNNTIISPSSLQSNSATSLNSLSYCQPSNPLSSASIYTTSTLSNYSTTIATPDKASESNLKHTEKNNLFPNVSISSFSNANTSLFMSSVTGTSSSLTGSSVNLAQNGIIPGIYTNPLHRDRGSFKSNPISIKPSSRGEVSSVQTSAIILPVSGENNSLSRSKDSSASGAYSSITLEEPPASLASLSSVSSFHNSVPRTLSNSTVQESPISAPTTFPELQSRPSQPDAITIPGITLPNISGFSNASTIYTNSTSVIAHNFNTSEVNSRPINNDSSNCYRGPALEEIPNIRLPLEGDKIISSSNKTTAKVSAVLGSYENCLQAPNVSQNEHSNQKKSSSLFPRNPTKCDPRNSLTNRGSNVEGSQSVNTTINSPNTSNDKNTTPTHNVDMNRQIENKHIHSNQKNVPTFNDTQTSGSGIESVFMNEKDHSNRCTANSKMNTVEADPSSQRSSYSNTTINENSFISHKISSHQSASVESSDVNKYNTSGLTNKENVSQNNLQEKTKLVSESVDKTMKINSIVSSNAINTGSGNIKSISVTQNSTPSGGSLNELNYSYISTSGHYSKSFQSTNSRQHAKMVDTSFQQNDYGNYNPSYNSASNQYRNVQQTMTTNSASDAVPLNTAIDNSHPTFAEVSKSSTNESETGKQSKCVQKTFTSGNPFKGDMHDLLKAKELEKNTFIPISYDDMRLPSEFSNDIFSSLQVPTGGHHPESISPTAAFLLAFPLVSTSRNVESLHETDNHENQTSTPTTILQIGNIDPPNTELFHPIDFQKTNNKSTEQFVVNNEYIQPHGIQDKQNPGYKRCDKRKDPYSDYPKEVMAHDPKTKSKAGNTNNPSYCQSYANNSMLPCSEYQYPGKDNVQANSGQWSQDYPASVPKDQKKACERKKEKVTQKGYYHQSYQDCYNYKDKKKKQPNRISVNWMSTPDGTGSRELTDFQPKEIEIPIAPHSQSLYSSISLDFPSEPFPDLSNCNPKKGNSYSWSPSKSLLPALDSQLMIPSTLPTLVGDLALGTSTPSESYKAFETPKIHPQNMGSKKAPENSDESKKRNDYPKSQANFFSVSQLVDPKSKKQKTNDRNYRRNEKNFKVRNNFPKRKDDHYMYYEDKNSFSGNSTQFHEKRNQFKGGSYSAESLIGTQSQEMEFGQTFNYQQNVNYFQGDFTNIDSTGQQYNYLQQPPIGGFSQDDCQDFVFGVNQRGLDGVRPKLTRKEDTCVREGNSLMPPQLGSYAPYSTKSLNYNIPPPSHFSHTLNTNSTNTLTNFNLSTIFPEMNDQVSTFHSILV